MSRTTKAILSRKSGFINRESIALRTFLRKGKKRLKILKKPELCDLFSGCKRVLYWVESFQRLSCSPDYLIKPFPVGVRNRDEDLLNGNAIPFDGFDFVESNEP